MNSFLRKGKGGGKKGWVTCKPEVHIRMYLRTYSCEWDVRYKYETNHIISCIYMITTYQLGGERQRGKKDAESRGVIFIDFSYICVYTEVQEYDSVTQHSSRTYISYMYHASSILFICLTWKVAREGRLGFARVGGTGDGQHVITLLWWVVVGEWREKGVCSKRKGGCSRVRDRGLCVKKITHARFT